MNPILSAIELGDRKRRRKRIRENMMAGLVLAGLFALALFVAIPLARVILEFWGLK